MDDQYIAAGLILAVGLLIGIATLPWHRRLSENEGPIAYVTLWALFWPFIVSYALWVALRRGWRAYVNAWQRYNWERKRHEEERRLSDITKTTRETFFKSGQWDRYTVWNDDEQED